MAGPAYQEIRWGAAAPNLERYQQRRRESQTMRLSYSGALQLEFVHRSGLLFQAGLGMQALHSRQDFDSPGVLVDSLIEVRDSITDALIRIDTSRSVRFTRSRVFNRNQQIAFEAGIGYQWQAAKWRPWVLAKAGYSRIIQARGMLQKPGDDIEILSRESDYIASDLRLHFGIQAGVDYKVAERWDLGINFLWLQMGERQGSGDPLRYQVQMASTHLHLVYWL